MLILRASDYRQMPWKNGGGTTTEIAVFPAGAGLDAFDWRISMARVESSGPFSLFAGIDRTLAIVEGDGINLTIGGKIPSSLTVQSQPLPFAADVETHATLIGGPITDLNVMTRRGRVSHSVERITVSGPVEISIGEGVTLLFCAQGNVAVNGKTTLGPRDTLVLDGKTAAIRIESDRVSTLFLIRLSAGDHAG